MLVSIFQNWANLQKALESAQSRPESLAGSETVSKTDTECFPDAIKDELENDHAIMKKIIHEEICLPKSTPILIHESNGAGKCRVLWNMVRIIDESNDKNCAVDWTGEYCEDSY